MSTACVICMAEEVLSINENNGHVETGNTNVETSQPVVKFRY
jgi:hypothetical protein